MSKIECCIAKDLLPLYIDDVLSEDSAEMLKDHLEVCESCHQEHQAMVKNLTLPTNRVVQEENSQVLKKFKNKWTKKKILISAVSVTLAIFLLFPTVDAVMESELFAPTTRARAGTVGQLHLGELSNGEWTRLYMIKKHLFGNSTSYWEPNLVFDNPFYKKRVINSANSATAVEMRILDTEGNTVVDSVSVEPGCAVSLEELEYWTEYVVEYRADGDFYMFAFD